MFRCENTLPHRRLRPALPCLPRDPHSHVLADVRREPVHELARETDGASGESGFLITNTNRLGPPFGFSLPEFVLAWSEAAICIEIQLFTRPSTEL